MITLTVAQAWGLAAMMAGLCALSAIVAAAVTSGWRPRAPQLRRLADVAPVAGDLEADAYPVPELLHGGGSALAQLERLEPLPPPSEAQAATTAAERAAAYDQLAPAALEAEAAAPELRAELLRKYAPPVPTLPPLPEPPRSADWQQRPDPGAAHFTSCAARYDSAMAGIMARLA